MGGMTGFGRVVEPGCEQRVEAPYHEEWEPRVFAMWAITSAEGLSAGSGRVLRERMPPEEYLRASYYERWQWSNERRLLARGTDRKSTRLNSSHIQKSRMPSSA